MRLLTRGVVFEVELGRLVQDLAGQAGCPRTAEDVLEQWYGVFEMASH